MATKAIQEEIVSDELLARWREACQKLVTLAMEIPDAKFDYRPADGVRTCSDILRHVAFWNQYVTDRARGKKGDDSGNELPTKEFSTKKQIIDALQRSNTDSLTALKEHKSGLTPEIADMLVTFLEHNCEHYGQLVVYARLNGIIPPASRA